MRVLISIEHPAWAHQFRYVIKELERRGHTVKIVAINKDRDLELLDAFGFKYDIISHSSGKNILEKGLIFLVTTLKIFLISLKFKPDIYVGRASPMMSINSFLMRKKHIIFEDSEKAGFSLGVARIFSSTIITPSCFRKNLGKKHIRIEGYKETFYLHPEYFKPDQLILSEVGLALGEKFVILRFVAWQAHHDIRHHGFSLADKFELVQKIQQYAKVFITSELPLPPDLEQYKIKVPPHRIHDLLFYANLLVTDSQTMTTEAAILGTPAVRCNTFVCSNDMGNFVELENKYDLIYCFRSGKQAIQKALELIQQPDLKEQWAKKRENLLEDKVDATKVMISLIIDHPRDI